MRDVWSPHPSALIPQPLSYAHLIPRRKQIRRLAGRIPKSRIGAAEDVPAAGRIDGIEAGHLAGDAEAAARHTIARGRPARHPPLVRPAVEIREACAKTEVANGEAERGDAIENLLATQVDVREEFTQVQTVVIIEGDIDHMPRCRVRPRLDGLPGSAP